MADTDSHGTCWHLSWHRSCLHAQALAGLVTNQANGIDLSCRPSGPSLKLDCTTTQLDSRFPSTELTGASWYNSGIFSMVIQLTTRLH